MLSAVDVHHKIKDLLPEKYLDNITYTVEQSEVISRYGGMISCQKAYFIRIDLHSDNRFSKRVAIFNSPDGFKHIIKQTLEAIEKHLTEEEIEKWLREIP